MEIPSCPCTQWGLFKTAPLESKKGCLYSMLRLRHLQRHPTVSNATSHSLVSPMHLLLHPTNRRQKLAPGTDPAMYVCSSRPALPNRAAAKWLQFKPECMKRWCRPTIMTSSSLTCKPTTALNAHVIFDPQQAEQDRACTAEAKATREHDLTLAA
jgi:hypothetical protein